MTITAPPREPRPASDRAPDNPATPYRRLWAAVLTHAYNDWWHRCERAKGHAGTIAKIHADFMNKPDPTDVITFEGDPSDPEEAGEICISADTARSNAAKFSNTFSRELSLYVAHGYLHLAGVDDISETDAKVMRRAETLALAIHDKHFKKPIFTFND